MRVFIGKNKFKNLKDNHTHQICFKLKEKRIKDYQEKSKELQNIIKNV